MPRALASVVVLLLLVGVLGTTACERATPPAPLLDLVVEASLAEVTRETGRIDLGTYPARFHLVDGWSGADQERDDISFVWGQGYESTLRFVVWRPRQRQLVVRGRPFVSDNGVPDWQVGVEVNGHAVGEIALQRGYGEYAVTVPGNVLDRGDNLLRLRYRLGEDGVDPFVDVSRHSGSRAVAWDMIELGDALDYGEFEARESASVLMLPLMARVDYHALAVPGSALVLGEIAPDDPAVTPENTVLEIELQAAGVEEPSRHYVRLDGGGTRLPLPVPGPTAHPVRISLMPVTQRPVPRGSRRLLLTGALVRTEERAAPPAETGRSPTPTAGSAGPAGSPATAPKSPAGTSLPRPPEELWEQQPDVLVYVIDALRADHLGVYGYDRNTSPELDAFAGDAVVFRRGVANSAWTRSAIASLFTGLYPESHGVLGREDALSPEAGTLARHLADAGYATMAVGTNGNVSRGFGFELGFDSWDQLLERRTETIHRYSDAVNEQIFARLDARDPSRPLFLYAHTTDPHEPYTPPQPYRRRFAPGVAPGAIHRPIRIAELVEERPELDLEALNRDFLDLYDAEIAFNDAQFGRLVNRLQEEGLYEQMLIVVLADHGEEFLDHGGWAHGKTLYGEQLDIPLLIKFPDNWAGGSRVDTLAEQVDVLPTILEVLGLEVPPEVQGNSMLGAPLAGEFGPVGMAMAQLSLDGRRTAALITDRWKLIRRWPSLHQTWGVELYDLFEDPGEQVDVGAERPVVLGWLRYLLRLLESGQTEVLTAGRGDPGPEMVERLRELGYLR